MTMPKGPHHDLLTDKIAIDCEMMRSNIGQVLGRVSIINYQGAIIYDTFVYFPEPVRITNTEQKYSGISFRDIHPQNGAQLFIDVQAELIKLFHGRTLIGHDVEKDMKVITLDLPSSIDRLKDDRLGYRYPGSVHFSSSIFDISVRDTQKCIRYRQFANPGSNQKPSLRNLSRHVLGREIKTGQISSVEDAIATMDVYKAAEEEIEREQGK